MTQLEQKQSSRNSEPSVKFKNGIDLIYEAFELHNKNTDTEIIQLQDKIKQLTKQLQMEQNEKLQLQSRLKKYSQNEQILKNKVSQLEQNYQSLSKKYQELKKNCFQLEKFRKSIAAMVETTGGVFQINQDTKLEESLIQSQEIPRFNTLSPITGLYDDKDAINSVQVMNDNNDDYDVNQDNGELLKLTPLDTNKPDAFMVMRQPNFQSQSSPTTQQINRKLNENVSLQASFTVDASSLYQQIRQILTSTEFELFAKYISDFNDGLLGINDAMDLIIGKKVLVNGMTQYQDGLLSNDQELALEMERLILRAVAEESDQ